MLSSREFGDLVRDRRRELDLTASQVAQAGGPSDTTISKIENGSPTPVTAATLRKLDVGLRWPRGRARQLLYGEAIPVSVGEARWRERVAQMASPPGIDRYEDIELAAELLRRLQQRQGERHETPQEGPKGRAGGSPADELLATIARADPQAARDIETIRSTTRRKSSVSDV